MKNKFFRRTFFIFTGFLILFFIVYQILFYPIILENLLKKFIFSRIENLDVHFQIRKSSLFSGFEIQNISLKDKITNTDLFTVKEFKFRYNLLLFFMGNVGINEIYLENPKFFLYKKDHISNYQFLISDQQKEKATTQEPLPESISIYIPLKLFFFIKINNLEFHHKVEEKLQTIEEFTLKNLSFDFGFSTKRFSRIPLNPRILNLFEEISMGLKGIENLYLIFNKFHTINGNPVLSLQLNGKFKNQMILSSHLYLDTNKTQISSEILNTIIRWNLDYKPSERELIIDEISIQNQNIYLLNLKGKIQHLKDSDNWYVEIYNDITKNKNQKFSLEQYGRALSFLTKQFFTGNIHFRELSFTGTLDDLKTKIILESDYLNFNQFRIQNLNLNLNTNLYLKKLFSFLYKEESTEEASYAFGIIKNLNLDPLSLYFNDAFLYLKGHIHQEISASLNVQDFKISMFTKPYLYGNISGNIQMQSDLELYNIDIKGNIQMNQTKYLINQYYSKFQDLVLRTTGNISLQNITKISLNIFELSTKSSNPEETEKQILIEGKTDLSFFAGGSTYQIQFHQFNINYNLLESHLPFPLQNSIKSYKQFLSGKNQISGNLFLKFAEQNEYKGKLNLLLSEFHPQPSYIEFDILQNKQATYVNNAIIKTLDNTISLHLTGKMDKQNEHQIYLSLLFQQKHLKELIENIFISGFIDLKFQLNRNQIYGDLLIKDISGKIHFDCDNTRCKYFELKNLNLKLPFQHFLNQKFELSYQSQKLKPEFRTKINYNFSVASFISNYSFDNLYFPEGFPIFGKLHQSKENAMEGYIEYKNNIVWIPELNIQSYYKDEKNGYIQLKDFYFNLADLNPANMEMGGEFYIVGLDLNSFFPKGGGTFQGIVNGFIYFKIKDFANFIPNLNINVVLYELSKDFAGFIVRIVSPRLIASVVNNTLSIKSISLELKEGLVYSTIGIESPGLFSLSRFIKPSSQEIIQERIPLSEFLKRSKEAQTGEEK